MIWFVGGSALDLNRGYMAYMNSFSFHSHEKGCNMMIHSLQPPQRNWRTRNNMRWIMALQHLKSKDIKRTSNISFIFDVMVEMVQWFLQTISTLFSPTQFFQPFQKLLSWFSKASTLVSVTVSWSVPFDSGGLPVLGYKAADSSCWGPLLDPGSLSVGYNKACSW